jgi:protein-S-isoprenylcysteine O-methyltransferase Ste14
MLKLLDFSERFLVVLLFALFCAAALKSFQVYNLPMLFNELISAVFILTRRPTQAVSQAPMDWALAFVGSTAVLLARPGGPGPLSLPAGFALVMMGTCIALVAKFSLARSFGLTAANRGVKRRGAYAFLRHPMYLGYMVAEIGFLLLNPTWRNVLVYAIAWSVQIARLLREERWLMMDPEYQAYAKHVRFRLIPGAF